MATERFLPREHWATRIGLILAVAGSAVGLGNFLRFPGRAALYGGGAFLIPYFLSLLILGIPIAWIEWTLARRAGSRGFHSAPGVFRLTWRHPVSRVFGAVAIFVPVVIYMYYVFIEAWCLGYAWNYLIGNIQAPADPAAAADYFSERFNGTIGVAENGSLFRDLSPVLLALVLSFGLNFWLIGRGVAAGIERFSRWAMPALIVAAVIILVRVLTLGTPDPDLPEQNVWNGLGYMWNPKPAEPGGSLFSALANPQVWLEAAGQVFFSIAVGFGIIINYATYVRQNDDVVLSSLTSSATNELCEVCLGGLITIPAAFLFLGAAPLAAVAGSSIGLGFHAVPVVFEFLPLGSLFGFLWFGLLFLAAVTSSVAMLQPALAFFEEGFRLDRLRACAALGGLTAAGAFLVVWFSRDTVALDVMDFWVGSTMLVLLALFEVVTFGWIFGAERGVAEANRGSDVAIPRFFAPIIRWVCPVYLVLILGGFAWQNLADQVAKVTASVPATVTAVFLLGILGLLVVLVFRAERLWDREGRPDALTEASR